MITVALFNHKGGVGKTSLAYHLGWIFSDLNQRALLVDLDPQANLTNLSIPEEDLEQLWLEEVEERRQTIYGAVVPIQEGHDAPSTIDLVELTSRLYLVPGDMRLSWFEPKLNRAWDECRSQSARQALRAVTAFYQVIQKSGKEMEADLVILDLGPNLGELNHAALLAADWVVIPLGADLLSVHALRNVGTALSHWRKLWQELCDQKDAPPNLPPGLFRAAGYVLSQPSAFGHLSTATDDYWKRQIPQAYANFVADSEAPGNSELGNIRNFHGLMPLAQRARKPVFHLTAADGALGSHYYRANEASSDFRLLARTLADRIGFHLASAW